MKKIGWVTWVLIMNLSVQAASREADWKRVRDAVEQGLPRTAITNLVPIAAAALRDRAYAEAVKAVGQRIALEAQVEGNRPDERIRRLEAELPKLPAEMTPMLDTLLAHWYWQFFQQNRWRFMQRTTTAQPVGDDLLTWDLPRIFERIDRQFQKALNAQASLKQTPIAEWDALLEKGTMPDAFRPTLYDFIAHQALQFYTAGEQAGARLERRFEFPAESPALGTTDEFLAWDPRPLVQPPGDGGLPPAFRAAVLFQELLRFHTPDTGSRLALAHADLERMTWAGNTAYGENRPARYQEALKRFIREWSDFDISALARERLSQQLLQADQPAEARQVALQGAELFPDSPGGKLCRNLVNEIEAKSISLTTEKVWNPPWPEIEVRYRNVQKVHFRALAYEWDSFLQRNRNRPESLNQRERQEVLAKPPVLEWSVDLPPADDYREKRHRIPAPATLKPGFYFIIASPDAAFGTADNMVAMADVWVSELALVLRTRNGALEGLVLEAATGEPLSGAEVATWYLDRANRVSGPGATTDEQGFFSLKVKDPRGHLLRVRHQGRELAMSREVSPHYYPGNEEHRPSARTLLFTDRALYRPGQMVQYKGICFWVDQAKDNYEILKGEQVVVVFRDVNGNEIGRQSHRANDFGSFSGTFTAPRDRLMGAMTLSVDGRAEGAVSLRVEEYKRPKFQVTLEAPGEAPKLNERVRLRGVATSYTGAAVDGAQVRFRVTRQVRMPWWWHPWRMLPFPAEPREIAQGTLTTGTDGAFTVEFPATPELRASEKDDPRFVFEVHTDVTDTAGETRSATRSLVVGYRTLEAVLSVSEWQVKERPVEVGIQTRTLDGDPQVAEGSVKVHALQEPAAVQRAPLPGSWQPYFGAAETGAEPDLANPENWPLGAVVAETGFTTDTNGARRVSFNLPAGAYRAVVESRDRFGREVRGQLTFRVLDPENRTLRLKIPHLVTAPAWQVQPGDTFSALWGTGYETGRALVEIEHRKQIRQRFWTEPGQTQRTIRLDISEEMRGGVTLRVTQVRENRAYLTVRHIEVPWWNKDLEVTWEHMVSKLEPGQRSTWTAVIRPRLGTEKLPVEMVAGLYDASLDAFAGHGWPQGFGVFRQEWVTGESFFANEGEVFQHLLGSWSRRSEGVAITYRAFPPDLMAAFYGFRQRAFAMRGQVSTSAPLELNAAPAAMAAPALADAAVAGGVVMEKVAAPQGAMEPEAAAPPPASLAQVSARKNLNETAFFFPHLTADSNGIVRMTFSMPEALTEWRFLGFAHDARLRAGYLGGKTVTAKDLMVQPNPPRFLREGDIVEFTVKVSNQSDQAQRATVGLNFTMAFKDEPADGLLKLTPLGTRAAGGLQQTVELPPKESRTLAWRLTVPDDLGFVTYKAVASTGRISDGEEGVIPVLSRRVLVTESLPLPLRGPGAKKFDFAKLRKAGDSKTLRHQSLTVQMVSQPAWYAVLALPYLMEFPHECSEQVFNRVYANALARHIANSDPRIRRVFDQWKNTPALDSPLEKNQDLKSVMLQETPWMRQAAEESRARRNVGLLFDENRLNVEMEATLAKLAQMQLDDGSWPWFPGGRRNEFITLYIATGFGRLRHLGVDLDVNPALRSLRGLDAWMTQRHADILKSSEPEKYVPGATDALYLYGRSFFLKDAPVAPEHQAAVTFFLDQGRRHWVQTSSRQTQAHLALALGRFAKAGGKDDPTPAAILRSLKERSVVNDELGRYWRDTELSWWWYRAPIETQALMIEAFDEVAKDSEAVEECRVWLLKQKQTQDWKTTKATADAVYALLLRGPSFLASDALVQVTLGGLDLTPGQNKNLPPGISASTVEPGTGFYEVRVEGSRVQPRMGQIATRKTDPGVAWGSVHWQYLEDIAKVTPHQGTPLKLSKQIFKKVQTARGPELQRLNGPAAVGDEVVVRIELRTDRDMEYLHLKDQRGSGTEPVNVLSHYKFQDGLAYYESTRDTASHFFIDYLPKGTYVFEYSSRVQLRGTYQTGVAEIQCMYAPEFNSHSESHELTVR